MKKKIGYLVVLIGVLFLTFSIRVYAEQYEYDALDRIIKVVYEDGSYVTYEYDANGNITKTEVYKTSEEESEEDSSEENSEEDTSEENSEEDTSEEDSEEDSSDEGEEDSTEPEDERTIIISGFESIQTYTGKAITPEPTVYDSLTETYLEKGKDYTVSYKNNIKAYTLKEGDSGFAAKKAPMIVIKGKGDFTQSVTIYFTIMPKSIEQSDGDSSIEIDDLLTDANGKVQRKAPVVKFNGKKLGKSDYAVSYPAGGEGAYKEPGSYPVVITGKGNFTGSRTISLIVAEPGTNLGKADIKKIPGQNYDGGNPVVLDEETLVVTMRINGKKETLKRDVDYYVEYVNNDVIGTAEVIIRAKEGSRFIGFKKSSFKINGISIKKAKVGNVDALTYTGSELKPSIEVVLGGTLKEGEDYTLTYHNNTNAGNASVTITGIGRYEGSIKKKFKIKAVDIATVTDIKDGEISVKYVKGGVKPQIELQYANEELEEGKDYSLSYKNNKSVYLLKEGESGYSAGKAPTITVKGKGNYKGTVKHTFIIQGRGLTDEEVGVTLIVPDKVESAKKGGYISKVTITDADGKVLKQGKDYSAPIYSVVNEKGESVSLNKTDTLPAGSVVTVSVTGLGIYMDEQGTVLSENYRITEKDFTKAKTGSISKSYTGRTIELDKEDFVNKDGTSKIYVGTGKKKTELIYGVDFEIVPGSYKNNESRGTASVTIRGIGTYGGNKTLKFKIVRRSLLY